MNSRLRLALSLTVAILSFAQAPTTQAATPSSGTVNAPTVGQPSTVTWTGGPLINPAMADLCPGGTSSPTCDVFQLLVNIPADFWVPNQRTGTLTIRISWPSSNNDLDLFVIDPNGNRIAFSDASGTTSEQVVIIEPIPGTYQIRTEAFFSLLGTNYTGSAVLAAFPPEQLHYSPNVQLFPGKNRPGTNAEPAIRVDNDGNIYVSTNRSLSGMGLDAWRIKFPTKAPAPLITYIGNPDNRVGGGDTDLAVALARNGIGNYNVYFSSLTLASVTLGTTQDQGGPGLTSTDPATVASYDTTHYKQNFFSSGIPCVDRQWNAAEGAHTLYMSFHNVCTGNNIVVVRSDDDGQTFPSLGPAISDPTVLAAAVPFNNFLGNIAVDNANLNANGKHNVYQIFIAGEDATAPNFNVAYLAVSEDRGATFTDHVIVHRPRSVSLFNDFPVVAVDTAGNLYAAWVEEDTVTNTENLFFTSSTDHGVTWQTPVKVNQIIDGTSANGSTGNSRTAMFPWIAAGCSGRVIATWYGTAAANMDDQNADWFIFTAQTLNGTSATPSFVQKLASDHAVLHGPIQRRVLDDFQIAIDPTDGMAAIAYTEGNTRQTFFTKQLRGPSSLACSQ